MKFADVVLPLPLEGLFTYSIPESMINIVDVGYRVIVPFGNRKHYTGIVVAIHENEPTTYSVKNIMSVIDDNALVNEQQLRLWQWIAMYYMCSLGEVYNAAVPAQLKLESESFLVYAEEASYSGELSVQERAIEDLLREKGALKISHIAKDLKARDILPYAHSLIFKGIVRIEESIIEKYKPRIKTFVRLNTDIEDAYSVIGNAKKQIELYNLLASAIDETGENFLLKSDISRKFAYSSSVLKGLIDKGVLIEFQEEVSRISNELASSRDPFPLNEYQQSAIDEIKLAFNDKTVCLLHGVTSSGKTEIYIHLIEEQLKQQKQVLFLVPEIALTTQLTRRLQDVFGDRMGVYHSRINDNERAEIWLKMQSDSPFELVIGVRSSIFLPFQNLGLVIVDEEHEVGFKQMDISPRYHARDTSIVLAQIFGARVLLGTATPSIESYYNAVSDKYGLVTLSHRFSDIEMPHIHIENTFELRRKKIMKSLLTPLMIEEIKNSLANNQQVMLFRNRRGFAPVLECKNCGWTPKCKNCDVSLTYHKYLHQLKCHYCNSVYNVVTECEVCKDDSVVQLGMGTEMLAEEVMRLFPEARVERMDGDTTRGKDSYERIIYNFQEGRTDILVGTQMLSKGLDFDNVSIVGIIAADGLLNHPDFRSHERGFQLMMQTAGRAGRKGDQGKVIIQAANPEMGVFRYLQSNDYVGFYQSQLGERKLFRYPPYTKLISIVFKNRNEDVVEAGSIFFANTLRKSLGNMVLGPNKPVVSYVKRSHIREILLKLDSNMSHVKVRNYIRRVESQFRAIDKYRYVSISYDVDMV